MDKDKLNELLETRALTEQQIEKLRAPMTILFSDIKGSTAYAEKKGDVEFMAMIDRHNRLLFPVIEAHGGSVVKTIGDCILAKFDDPMDAVKAAVGMQRALAKDRSGRELIDQIHTRIGIHYGMGLIKDNDVFGDVVNAASRVEHQAEADQILITDVLLEAGRLAGFECAKMGRAELKGKDEPIDLYAVAWSDSTAQQLIEDIQEKYEKKLIELKAHNGEIEEEFEKAREQWRIERRALNADIEGLETDIEQARETARQKLSEDLQAELRFQIDELNRSREQVEHDLATARQKFEAERNNLKAQIATLQASVVEAMERSNNPARVASAVRDQVESRIEEAKQLWQLQWEADRKRLVAEIERLKKAPFVAEEKKEAARRTLLEKLGKLPAGSSGPAPKSADQWEREFQDAKIDWDTQREQLNLKIRKAEMELRRAEESMRGELLQKIGAEYESRFAEASRERQRLEQDIQSATSELARERQRLNARIKALEEELPEAQKAARKQAVAELQADHELKLEEANRLRSRTERKHQDLMEEWEAERRRANKQIATLQEQLKEAREAAYKAQRGSARTAD